MAAWVEREKVVSELLVNVDALSTEGSVSLDRESTARRGHEGKFDQLREELKRKELKLEKKDSELLAASKESEAEAQLAEKSKAELEQVKSAFQDEKVDLEFELQRAVSKKEAE